MTGASGHLGQARTVHRMSRTSRAFGMLVALLVTLLSGILLAAPASAHASVDSTLPEDGAVLAEAPPDVVIAFNEEVTMSADAARLTDANGNTVGLPAPQITPDPAGSLARITPFPQVPDGWYAVSWNAVSADGHTIKGAFTFYIGDPTAATEADKVDTEAIDDPTARFLLFAPFLRGLSYLATMLAVGALFALWALSSPRHPMPDRVVARVRRLAAWSAGVGLLVTPLTILNNAILLNGGSFDSLWPTTRLILQSSGGAALLVRMSALFGLCTAVLLLMEKATRKVGAGIVVVSAVAMFVSFPMGGHAAVIDEYGSIAFAGEIMHLLAGAIWLGGIPAVLLAVWSRKSVTIGQTAEAIDRFSKLATVSVFLVIIGGGVLSWTMFTEPAELVTTPYGLMLLAKVAVVGLVAALGAYNHFVLVPALRAAAGTAEGLAGDTTENETDSTTPEAVDDTDVDTTVDADQSKPKSASGSLASRHLRGTMVAEALALLAILTLTSLMTTSPAPKAAGNHLEHLGLVHNHGGGGATNLSADLQLALEDLEPRIYTQPMAEGELELTIAPGRAGADNRIVVTYYKKNGRVGDLAEVEAVFLQEELGVGPIERLLSPQGDGTHMLTGRDLGAPGAWQVRVDVTLADGSRDFAEYTLDIKAARVADNTEDAP